MKFNRRNFFVKMIQGAAVLSVPAALSTFLESCMKSSNPLDSGNTSSLTQIQGSISGNTVIVTVDSSSPLSKTGSAAAINYTNGQLLVDHPSGNQFTALSSICTHAGCTVSGFDSGSNQFVCPCHGSRYDLSGNVVQGPASQALPQYQTSFANNVLTIKI
ncbi:MAG: ubiquinol-cytochrome c reductase iron-sulfur subunit [Ignavibacteriaceae bacterium]|nr:ubiquinol-cytochrome c reductase iron-sulfur subunit [Ignavibacteriaceae bacterium]